MASELLLDSRCRPRLADHPDWALAAATGAELDGNGVLELPQLDKRRQVVVVQRQASALVLVEQEGMEAEVARTLRQDEDSWQQPRHDPVQRDRLQPERVAPRSHVERRLDPLGRPRPPRRLFYGSQQSHQASLRIGLKCLVHLRPTGSAGLPRGGRKPNHGPAGPSGRHSKRAPYRTCTDRGESPLSLSWIRRKLRCCLWRAGQLAKAIHVLQTRELGGLKRLSVAAFEMDCLVHCSTNVARIWIGRLCVWYETCRRQSTLV